MKFTDRGDVALHIAAPLPRPGTAPTVLFSVTGIGIGSENLTSIFSAFQQADGTTSRRYGGTGLGLAICREVAAQLGGDVTVQSELGVGSTFSLEMPVTVGGAPSPQTAVTALAPAQLHAALAGHKVLVVDDDPRNAFVLTARAMQGDREKSTDAGASDYITKPIDTEELLDCMERWLSPNRPRPATT